MSLHPKACIRKHTSKHSKPSLLLANSCLAVKQETSHSPFNAIAATRNLVTTFAMYYLYRSYAFMITPTLRLDQFPFTNERYKTDSVSLSQSSFVEYDPNAFSIRFCYRLLASWSQSDWWGASQMSPRHAIFSPRSQTQVSYQSRESCRALIGFS